MSKNGAVGYFRVSTAEQAHQNNSLPTQEAKFSKFCMNNGLTEVKIFTDKQSARTDARHEFQKMLAYCQQNRKKISHVIVADLSRLARNVLDQGQAIVSLKQCPRRDLNPCYRRESTVSDRKLLKLRNTDGYLKRFP